MTVNNISGVDVKALVAKMDAEDGNKDGKIQASIWNNYADKYGCRKIKNFIMVESAINSLNKHLNQQTSTPVTNLGNKQNQNTPSSNTDNKYEIQPFGANTINLNKLKIPHRTKLLDVAQDNLGLYEISEEEFEKIRKSNPQELQNTQYKMIGDKGAITDSWCAHTVSHISIDAGMKIGAHKIRVQDFIDWAKDDYKPIKTNEMTKNNYLSERTSRAKQIAAQLPNMHEGDFIVWKTQYLVNTGEKSFKQKNSSHIGIIESVDEEKGIVTVIEGNANIARTSEHQERYLVTNKEEGKKGAQDIGDFQEINNRDGLIRKEYTIEELVKTGYSGYIDNQSRII